MSPAGAAEPWIELDRELPFPGVGGSAFEAAAFFRSTDQHTLTTLQRKLKLQGSPVTVRTPACLQCTRHGLQPCTSRHLLSSKAALKR